MVRARFWVGLEVAAGAAEVEDLAVGAEDGGDHGGVARESPQLRAGQGALGREEGDAAGGALQGGEGGGDEDLDVRRGHAEGALDGALDLADLRQLIHLVERVGDDEGLFGGDLSVGQCPVHDRLPEQRLGLPDPRGCELAGPLVPVAQPLLGAAGAGPGLERPDLGLLKELGAAGREPGFGGVGLGDGVFDGVVGQLPGRQLLRLPSVRTHVRVIPHDDGRWNPGNRVGTKDSAIHQHPAGRVAHPMAGTADCSLDIATTGRTTHPPAGSSP